MSEDLSFRAVIDRTQWRADIEAMRRDVAGFSNNVTQQSRQIDSSFRTMAGGIAGYFSAQALVGFTQQLITVRGEFQKTEIAFTTMLGSAEKSKALMGQMVDLAAKTPFGLQDVSDGAKRLLAFQIPAEQVVDTLTRIGNVAAGLGVPMGQLIHVYGQVKAQGKLMTNDLYQFMNAGIPMTAELAKVMGVAENKVKDLITEGKVGFPEVQKVIANLTNEGGMFFNLMEEQSKSLSGQVANLQDAFDQLLNKIGESSQDFLSGGISELTYLVENYQQVLSVLQALVLMYGTYRAALIAQTAILNVAAAREAGFTVAMMTRLTATKLVDSATKALNATMLANPYAIAAALVVGLTYAIAKMATETTYAEQAQDNLNKKLNDAKGTVSEQKAKIESLIIAIQSENTSNEQRANLLKQIKTLAHGRLDQLTVEAIRTGKATEAINEYINALDRQAKAQAYQDILTQNYKRITEINNRKNSTFSERVGSTFAGATYQDQNGNFTVKSVLSGLGKKSADAIKDNEQVEKKALETQNKSIKEQIKKNAGDLADAVVQTSETAGKSTEKSAKKVTKAVEQIFSEDTIKGLQQRVDKYREVMEKSVIGSDAYNNAKSSMESYQKKLDKLTEAIHKKSFEEQLSETKRQIEVRDKLLAAGYSKETVDGVFPSIKDATFEQYLQDTINSLKKLINEGKGTAQTASDLALFSDELEKWKGYSSYIDLVGQSIDELKSKFSGSELIKQLDVFAKSNLGNETEAEINSKRQAAEKAKQEEIKRMQDLYKSILEEQKTFEEKSRELAKEYDDLKKTDEYENASQSEKDKIEASYSSKISKLTLDAFKDTELWAAAFGDLEFMSQKALQKIRDGLVKYKAETKNLKPTEVTELNNAISNVDRSINKNPFKKLVSSLKDYKEAATDVEKADSLRNIFDSLNQGQQIFNAIGQGVQELGDAFGGFDAATEDAIGNIMAIGNAAFDLGKSIASGDIAGMISAGVKLIASIGKSLSGDQKKERNIQRQSVLLKELETAYNNVAYAAEKAFGSQKYDGQKELIKNLEQQKAVLESMLRIESTKKKSDANKIADYKAQINGINQSIDDIKTKIVEDVLQTSVVDAANQIGDALVDAFGRGESAIDAVDKAANNMVKNLLKNQLNLMLQNRMKPILDDLLKSAGFNSDGTGSFTGLSPESIKSFKDQVNVAAGDLQSFINAYSDVFKDISSVNPNSLSGAIKGLTEETGSVIAGNMNAQRILLAEIRALQLDANQVLRASLLQLAKIEENTRRLHNIDKNISELNAKTKNELAGL